MNKLEEGMYVRFKDKKGATYIRKLTKLANEYPQKLYGMEIDEEANYSSYLSLKNILKASHNIIDLIEAGDYVNGEKVTELMIKMRDKQGVFGLPDNYKMFVEEIPIKTIVTKQQFESMEYKVGGNSE